MKRTIISLISLVSILGTMNCNGGFVATRKIYNWNQGLGNKWVQSIVMWVMIVIPVYPIVLVVGDFLILNTLEFWTGSNPMAMKPGESETQLVHKDGKEYEITARQNQFEIREVANGKVGDPVYLTFKPEESAWYAQTKGKSTKISEMTETGKVKFFHPDGRVIEANL
ncbi:MAG: DUF3332 family protein [Turneriella sp.]|nr:DUF3332 family protein [Turneriella sp.]